MDVLFQSGDIEAEIRLSAAIQVNAVRKVFPGKQDMVAVDNLT